jgi:ribonuclease HII
MNNNRNIYNLQKYYKENCLEVGIDEAGRGPMFGAVYIGAVILPQDNEFNYDLLRDSKKLSERKRLVACDYIKENAVEWNVFNHDEKIIDEINIRAATLDGMHRVIAEMNTAPEHIIVDGDAFHAFYCEKRKHFTPYTLIKGGDNLYTSIAAASILAKVTRDKYVIDLCDRFPLLCEYYSLNTNKGYGAKKHIEGIKQYGITNKHRKTFGLCKYAQVNELIY